MAKLSDLLSRVAGDVDDHRSRMAALNSQLATAEPGDGQALVDIVARLVATNRQMQRRLNASEEKLREQARQIETCTVEARTDHLTLLSNRRAFDAALVQCLEEYHRDGQAFSVILTDIDHFKRINDEHGHPAGDEVLKGFARTLRRTLRDANMVARYGGEEFAVILPRRSARAACRAAQGACETLRNASFRVLNENLQVTASFGVSQAVAQDDSQSLLTRADQALYAAKTAGRDGVYWHDGQRVQQAEYVLPTDLDPGQSPAGEAAPAPARGAPPARAAVHDSTLGLSSRTYFCQQVRTRIATWKAGGPAFAIALLRWNLPPRHCSPLPPPAIQWAASVLKAAIQEPDVASYFATNCFTLLLCEASAAEGGHLVQQLCQQMTSGDGDSGRRVCRDDVRSIVVEVIPGDDTLSLLQRAEAELAALETVAAG